jgi:predicted RNA-binding protein with PUA-like domain
MMRKSTTNKATTKPKPRGNAKPTPSRPARSFSRPVPGVSPRPTGAWHFPARTPGECWYWLLKQEPTDFSFDDMWAPPRTTNWNGVRNYAARNFLRDHIKTGDRALFYHSSADPSAVVGVVEVLRDGYPDESALDKRSPYYDAKSTRAEPLWYQVDVRAIEKFEHPVSLAELKRVPELATLVLLHISQLSVQPVTAAEWDAIVRLARGGR